MAEMLRSKGATVIDADAIAREVVLPGRYALRRIHERFGNRVINSDGTLNRQALAQVVFSSPKDLADLNSIIHPEILGEIARRVSEAPRSAVVVIDAALLVEVAAEVDRAVRMDALMVVASRPEDQLERMQKQRGMTKSDAEARIWSQASLEEKLGAADYVIRNYGSLDDLRREVEVVWAKIRART